MKNDDLYSEMERSTNVDYIKQEIYLMETLPYDIFKEYPHKNDMTVTCVCTKGEIRAKVNLQSVRAKAPGLLVLLPEQILQFEDITEDFQGIFIIMCKQFIEKISLLEGFSTFMSIRDTPYIPLNEGIMNGILDYYRMVRNVLRYTEEDFNRKAVVNHLTIAFFYGVGYYLHKLTDKDKKTRSEIILEDFLKLAQKHFKQERGLEFYADKLCFTTNYLSAAVKSSSGKTARQWIDDYVILEAKRLLKSTDLSVQQISDELNFPSQSFFGKYFKREVGISPKQYRINT